MLKPVTDSRVQAFIASRNVRRYMEKVLRDYLKFGNGAVQFVPSAAGNSFCRGQSGQCALPPLFRSGRIRSLQVHRFRILAATSGQGTIHQAGCALRIRPADARRGVEVCRKGEGQFHHAGTRQLEQRRPLRHAHLVARLRLWMGGDSPSYPPISSRKPTRTR